MSELTPYRIENLLKTLLAVIHQDGGHFTRIYGVEKSTAEAIKEVVSTFSMITEMGNATVVNPNGPFTVVNEKVETTTVGDIQHKTEKRIITGKQVPLKKAVHKFEEITIPEYDPKRTTGKQIKD